MALLSFALPGCVSGDFGGDSVHQTLHEQLSVSPSPHVRVANVSGFIRILPWGRSIVDVAARKHASSLGALQRTSVVITHDGSPASDVEIDTHYAHNGFFFWGESGASVDYTIHVPRGTNLDLANVSGDVSVSGIAGDVQIRNVSGDVEALRLDGNLQVHTVSGTIDASLLRMNAQRDADLEAVSGAIHLAVPPKSSADVTAESISGGFSTDFNVPMQQRTVGVHAQGPIGGGAGTIQLRTISGSITLSKL